jgi:capsular polysaccharide biosynthesis protein
MLQPLKYRSKSRLLIAQPNMSADAYAIARSNQYIGGLISEVVYSGAFLKSLDASDAIFDRNYFSGTYKQNIKKWKKTVFARSGGDSGIVEIEIYHTDPAQAKQISLAVNDIIISGEGPYQFANNQIKITTIDEPIISSFPVKPNIPLNLLASLIFGISFSLSYIYFFPASQTARILNKRKLAKLVAQEQVLQTADLGQIDISDNEQLNLNIRPEPIIPDNLPVYGYGEVIDDLDGYEEQTIDNEAPVAYQAPKTTESASQYWLNEEPLNFQGNIKNVLGE